MAPFPGQRQGQVLSFFKESHPQDIFAVMWKKRLGNPLSDGMAGMRNGNSFAFYTVSGKGNKNKKSIGVGQHSQCLSWKVLSTGTSLIDHFHLGPRPTIATGWQIKSAGAGELCLSHDFGVPTSICESRSEETATFPGTTSVLARSHAARRPSQSRNGAVLPSGNLQKKALSIWRWEFLERRRPTL